MSEVICRLTAKPSEVIKHYEEVITVGDVTARLNLITMERSFLLTISNIDSVDSAQYNKVSRDNMIRGFSKSNETLKNLSLAVGTLNTCLIDIDNPLGSASLASRLSKKLNLNRPVYVANNLTLPHDLIDPGALISRFYMAVFQFIQAKYDCDSIMGKEVERSVEV